MNSFKLLFAAIALSGTCNISPALADEPQMNTYSNSREEKEIIEEQTKESIIDLIETQGLLLEETELIEEIIDESEIKEISVEEAEFGTTDITAVQNATRVIVAPSGNYTRAKEPESERIFEVVEQQAQFPGGQGALRSWLFANLRYPEEAMKLGIEGRVIVQVVVEKDGSITHPVIVRGVDKDLDKAAIRLVKAMPKWIPGRNNGEVVRSRFTLPVVFKLQK